MFQYIFLGIGTQSFRPICKQEQTATTSESMDALFDFMMENVPVAAAVGGVAASTALVANPSLPMTGSNGVPPGTYIFFLLTYLPTLQVRLWLSKLDRDMVGISHIKDFSSMAHI